MTDDVLDLDIHGLAIEVWPDVERVVRMLFPVDSDPDGEWLLTVPHPLAGDDYEITGVADTFGDPERPRVSFTLPADRMRDVMRQRFVISFDGVPKLSGPLRVATPQAAAGETTVSITLVEPQALDVDLTVIGGVTPGDTAHTVAAFADDFDPTGSFTTVPLLPGGDTPRAYLTGATVLVVGGDHLGLWTIPASGPATAGAALAPGDVIASQTGRMAVAQTADGSTVFGVLIQADLPYVDAALAAETEAREQADDALGERIDDVETSAAATSTFVDVIEARLRMVAQAARVPAPTLWAVGGGEGHVWEADWQAPDPTSTFEVEAWVKVLDAREPGFIEIIAESIDGLGDNDRYEVADWYRDTDEDGFIETVDGYAEGTKAGADQEYHQPPTTQQDLSALSPIVPGVWVRRLWAYDFDDHTITTYVEDDLYWHLERHGRRWAPLAVYTNPEITSLHPTEGYATWLIRGVGDHLLAYEAIYVDGTEVQRFDASTAEPGDTVVYDSVAVDDEDNPLPWNASGTGAEIDTAPTTGGGGVDSVNGQTGTVTLEAADVGAAADDDARLSDARTPTAHKTSHATGGGDALTPSDIGAAAASHTHSGLVSHVRAAADLGPRTHPTFTIDDILQFPCTSGVVYWIEGFLVFQGDATADLRLNLSLPSGSYQLKFQHPLTTVSGTSDYDRFTNVSSLASNAVSGIAGASTPISVSVSGWVAPTADGTVGILWGASSAGAGTGVTRLANSFLRYGVLT